MSESNICVLEIPKIQLLETRKVTINQQNNLHGVLIAGCIMSSWIVSLLILLSLDPNQLPIWSIPLACLWQTFLYTGLFITAHDAMHGSICPQSPKVNHLIGTIATTGYGFFSYKELLRKHQLHHRYPATDRDPDFHDGQHQNPIFWYFSFMQRYWSWRQIISISCAFMVLYYMVHLSYFNLLLFWAIPSILSSVQLFFFGTFLPHREPKEGYQTPHRTQTNPLPIFWSFITCYHFGYHYEHHEYPQVPWWQLPAAYQLNQSIQMN